MNSIVENMANISIPEEVMKKLDMGALLADFTEDYKSLDNISKARELHESRNILLQWFYEDELKTAQLDSVQLQARYAKKIGQLMIISIAQSQALNEQQRIMSEQQTHIKKQAEDIHNSNILIQEQQTRLAEQQAALENLIKEFVLLKGLTTDEARRVILIATDVKKTKAELTSEFNALANRFEEILESNRKVANRVAVFHKEIASDFLSSKNQQLTQMATYLTYIKLLAAGLGITIAALCASLFFTLN
jgi:hypothetical protein